MAKILEFKMPKNPSLEYRAAEANAKDLIRNPERIEEFQHILFSVQQSINAMLDKPSRSLFDVENY